MMQRRSALDAVLAHLELLGAGRRPPVDRARLVAVDVVAQAVELARPEPLGQRQQVAAEHAVAELGIEQLERRGDDEHLVGAGDDGCRAASPSTSLAVAVSGPTSARRGGRSGRGSRR